MKIAIVYVHPVCAGQEYQDYALRFVASYHASPPGVEHETVVVINGGKANSLHYCIFSSLSNLAFIEHDNSGYDIGAYQFAARSVPCDMMVFFGASTYFKGGGWLCRMVEAINKHGNAQYGVMGNRGNLAVKVFPHLRTTGLWMSPQLMNRYPFLIHKPEQRYPFEHGNICFSAWVQSQGLKNLVVTWSGEYEWQNWDAIPNGYHSGNQSALLVGDRMTEPPFYPYP